MALQADDIPALSPIQPLDDQAALPPPSGSQLLSRLPLVDQLPMAPFGHSSDTRPVRYVVDALKERARLPSKEVIQDGIKYYLAYTASSFAVLHEPSLWSQVDRLLSDTRVSHWDCFTVNGERRETLPS